MLFYFQAQVFSVTLYKSCNVFYDDTNVPQIYLSLIQVSPEPPLGRRIISCGATEVSVDCAIESKVVFTGNSSSLRLEGTTTSCAVNVQGVNALSLPKLCCGTASSRMSTDIHILHWKALAITKKCRDVKVAELASDVISVIDCFLEVLKAGPVEAAGCAPVCGTAAEGFHSSQSLAIRVPVWCVVVYWCVLQKCLTFEMRQIF